MWHREVNNYDICMLYCCWQHTYAIKALLCNTQCFYGADSNIQLSIIHNMHCCFTSAILVMTMHSDVACTLSCSQFYIHIHLGIIISYLLTHTTMMSSPEECEHPSTGFTSTYNNGYNTNYSQTVLRKAERHGEMACVSHLHLTLFHLHFLYFKQNTNKW